MTTADRNLEIARALLAPGALLGMQSSPWDWAGVFAFYSAVHYVNAYLWERQQYEPRTHDDRERCVARGVDLQLTLPAYRRPRVLAYNVRYLPTYRPRRTVVLAAVQVDLPLIVRTIQTALQLS